MHHRRVEREPRIHGTDLRFLAHARRAVLVTVAPDGLPRPVPICHAVLEADGWPVLYTPIDAKPKASPDPLRLARVGDVVVRPDVVVLVDRWDEDWRALAWLRVHGRASMLAPGGAAGDEHARAVGALRVKYRQYADHPLERRPLIRVRLGRTTSWGRLAAEVEPR